jgi:ABC-type phosphate transport system substrate-binding protein
MNRKEHHNMMWNKLKSALLVPALLMSCMLFSGTALADAIAIVKADHPTDTISKKDLKKILLGKTKKWDDGSKVVLVILEGGDAHDKFVKKFAGKTAKQFQNFWRKMVFSGKGKMPQTFASEADLAAFVAANPGAIGYVAAGAGAFPSA